MKKHFLKLAFLSTFFVLVSCGTNPGKKAESLDSVSADKVFSNLNLAVKNKLVTPKITARETQFTFDWRDTLLSTSFGRVPVKVLEFDLEKIKENSKPKHTDRFKLPEISNPKFISLCSYFSQADRNSVATIVPELFWLDSKGKLIKIVTLYYNRNVNTGLRGCLVSTIPLPEGFETSPKVVVHPKRFDSFVKPIATFQNETMVATGAIFIPIKGMVTVLPDVIGDIKVEISDLPKFSDGAKSIEDLN